MPQSQNQSQNPASTSSFGFNPSDELNDLRMSARAVPLYEHVKRFVAQTVEPMSEQFAALGEGRTGADRWQYAPFGAGPRTCIGDHFAMLEATLALATVLRRIEITSVDDDFPVEFPFTLVAAEPIRAMVHRR